MGLLWDKRWEKFFAKELGEPTLRVLREIIPPTLIVGEEDHFAPGLPNGATDIASIAALSKSKRTLVLKPSSSSWAEGLQFLHKKSGKQVQALLGQAASDKSGVSIIQEFRPGRKVPMTYEDNGDLLPMTAKIRVTPYFGADQGDLVAIKATGCENTDLIHGSSTSINTAVSVA